MSEEIEEKQFESSMQIKDWKKRVWRFNYTKHIKSIDWEVVTPKGEIKVTKMGDFELAKRCLDNLGIINQLLLEHEVKWLIDSYTNSINIKALKAIQSEVQE